MKIRPLHDRILVKRIEAVQKSPGGIIIPLTASEKPTEALVIAVGPGKVNEAGVFCEPRVKVGDKVLLPEYGGDKLELDKTEYHLFREQEILGILESK